MALNKFTLDVSGRLSLLGPQPEVMQILKRAGIHNILRIFDNEEELLKTSEDIILQTSSFQLNDLKNLAQQEPHQSEFDQLRSEIGSVFGGPEHDSEIQLPPPPKTKSVSAGFQNPGFVVPQTPVDNPNISGSSIEQEFDDAFSQFESENSYGDANISGQDQYSGNIPPQASYIPPPPPTRTTGFHPVGQFTPQPPVAPVPPRPKIAQSSINDSMQKPPVQQSNEFTSFRNDHFQMGTPPVPPRPVQSSLDLGPEEDISPVKPSKKKIPDNSFDESDDDFFDEEKKKSSMPMVLIVVLLLVLGGVGAYFAFTMLNKKPVVQTVVNTTSNIPQKAPEIQSTPSTVDTTVATSVQNAASVEEEPEETVQKKPAERKAAARSTVKSKPKSESRVSKPAVTKSTTVEQNKVVIASTPSGARVTINGDYLGITPYTWDKPIFGPLSVVISKDGYEDDSRVFEFTGGSVRESFTLRKAAITTPPPVAEAVSEPESFTPPEPEPQYTPEPVVAKSEPEPAPIATPAPVTTPVASSVSVGGNASIFIASIPPVADVFLDGKLVGKTNVSEIKLPAGTHNLKFVKGVKEAVKVITVQPGKNPSQMVRLQ